MTTDYEAAALQFLENTKTALTIKLKDYCDRLEMGKKSFCYDFKLVKGNRSYSGVFSESIAFTERVLFDAEYSTRGISLYEENRRKSIIMSIDIKKGQFRKIRKNEIAGSWKPIPNPSAYSILACLTKYDPGTLEDFCSEFGYDIDSKKAEKVYQDVRSEYLGIAALFNEEEMNDLQEIN